MKIIHFGIVIVSFFMIFTTGFAFGDHLPVGFKTWAPAEGEECMSHERTSWIKEKAKTEEGCVKVGYTVPLECGRWSNEWRSERGMSDCQPPPTPTASPVPTPVPVPAPAPPTVYDFTEPTPAPVPMQSAQEDDYTIAIAAVSMFIIVGIIIGLMKQKKKVNSEENKSAKMRSAKSKEISGKMQQQQSAHERALKRDMAQNVQREKEILTSKQKGAKFEIESWLVRNWTIVTLKSETSELVDIAYIKEKLEKDREMKKYLSVYEDWKNLLLEHQRRFSSHSGGNVGRDWHNRDNRFI